MIGWNLSIAAPVETEGYLPFIHQNSQGDSMPYRLLKPLNYDKTLKYPVVVFFHGAGERGTNNQSQLVHGTSLFLKSEARQKYPCFVVAPQCPENQQWVDMSWGGESGTRPKQPSKAMNLVLEILEYVKQEYSIDNQRIYVTGLSMGGYATWDCITRFPEKFAAAAPICGGGDENTITSASAKVPVWAFHSDDDTAVLVVRTRKMIQAMRNAGGNPKYFEYYGLGHNSWGQAYSEPELLPWLFSQKLGQVDMYTLKTPLPELPPAVRWPEKDELFPGNGPLQKADWFQKLWVSRRLQWWRNRDADKNAVIFLGDSITQGWSSLKKDFPQYKVANRGISGDTTRGVRYRLAEDVLILHPTAVVLLIGTNDLGLGGKPEDTIENLKQILAKLHDANPNMPVILCRIMPRAYAPGRFPDYIKEVNASMDELAKVYSQISLCDTFSIFADEQGAAKKAEFPDLLHPNSTGYAKWKEVVRPLLEKALLK